MYLDGCYHDLILKIDDREFRVQKDVLRVRSRVFKSMFCHDVVEKDSGVVDIPDCDTQVFEQCLFCVCCRNKESINQSNMSELYSISDKYEMNDLKKECFIKKSLYTTTVCDFIQLAKNHRDSFRSFRLATEYFTNNMPDILRTVEWQNFMKHNSTVANELIIKTC